MMMTRTDGESYVKRAFQSWSSRESSITGERFGLGLKEIVLSVWLRMDLHKNTAAEMMSVMPVACMAVKAYQ